MPRPKCNSPETLLRLSDPERLTALGFELKSGPSSYHDHADHLWGAAERIENFLQLKADFEVIYGEETFDGFVHDLHLRAVEKPKLEAEAIEAIKAELEKDKAGGVENVAAREATNAPAPEGLVMDTERGPVPVEVEATEPPPAGQDAPPADR